MLNPEQFRARTAFLRFQHALDSLEQEMEPMRSGMSIECQFELETVGKIARSFFRMANEEVFSVVQVKPKAQAERSGIRG